VWWLIGSDYITIDGIDIVDQNTSNPATMEFGYGLYKASGTDGCQHNTIKNCTVTLKRNNSIAGSGLAAGGGSRGIEIMGGTPTSNYVAVNTTTTSGTNSYNRIYSNVIQSCHVGIGVMGFSPPSAPYTNGDQQNDVGGLSAATSNTIINFGGSTGGDSFGIRTLSQYSLNISYNYLNNNNGGGGDPYGNDLYAIRIGTATAASASINSNTIVLSSSGTDYDRLNGIHNLSGSLTTTLNTTNTVTINNNVFPSYTYTGSSAPSCTLICSEGIAGSIVISNNIINNVAFQDGDFAMIYSAGHLSCSITSNTITNISSNGSYFGNTIYGIRNSAETATVSSFPGLQNISGNYIDGISCSGSTTVSYGKVYAIHAFGANSVPGGTITLNYNTVKNITGREIYGIKGDRGNHFKTAIGNSVSNFHVPQTSAVNGPLIYGIWLTESSSTVTVNNNSVHGLTSVTTGTDSNTGHIRGISVSDAYLANISQNRIDSLHSLGTGLVWGMEITYGSHNVYNNLIGNLSIPNSTLAPPSTALAGIFVNTYTVGTSNIYYNTVHLNAGGATGPNFSSAALSCYIASTVNLQNNILINTSVPTGTGVTSAFSLAGGGALMSHYATASNRNLFYAGTPGPNHALFYYNNNTTYTTLPVFKSYAAPREAQSVTEIPPFISLNGLAPNFLNIDPSIPTQVESGAGPIAGYTVDYAGNVRNATTPDIGAWEGNYTQSDIFAPAVSSSGFTSPDCNNTTRTYTVSISDVSGVATGSLSPRIYCKVNFGLYTSSQGTLTSGTTTNGVWTFDLNYSAVPSDVVYYFLAVQDQSPLSNLTLSPSAGSSASDVNNVTIPPNPASNFTVSTCTTIYEQAINDQDIRVYPNPNNGEFTLSLSKFSENTSLELYNMVGELVLSKKIESLVSSVNIEHLAKGMYVLQLSGKAKILTHQKIVKE
jgi:hypothetical protein